MKPPRLDGPVRPPRLLLSLAILTLLAPATASTPPIVAHGAGSSTTHDVAVVTADFVAYEDPVTGQMRVTFACTATQPGFGHSVLCQLWMGGSYYLFIEGAHGTTATAAGSEVHPASPATVRLCASLYGSSIPYACAQRVT